MNLLLEKDVKPKMKNRFSPLEVSSIRIIQLEYLVCMPSEFCGTFQIMEDFEFELL